LLKSPIKVVETDAEGDFYGAYHLKTVCDYFYADRILRDTSPKNYIGLVLYNSTDAFVDKDYNFIRNDDRARPVSEGNALRYDIPQRKFRSLEYYSKFFELARRCGYDVITLDAHEKLDQKVEFLLKNCAAVIGYEGGIAHLCHMLRIPYIMLDHQQPNTNPYGVFQCDMMHQAKTVHILRDEEKFLQLERWQLSNLIGHKYSLKALADLNFQIRQ
jgi:hypothetical protein